VRQCNVDEAPSFGPDAGQTIEAWFSAPARMPCGFCLGVPPWLGAMHLVFRYRHPLLGPESASHFAERYLTELDRLVPGVTA
jgi:hypothetical protein